MAQENATKTESPPTPLRFGIDDADEPLIAYTRHAKGAEIFAELGFDCYVCHSIPRLSCTTGLRSTVDVGAQHASATRDEVKTHIREIDGWCHANDIVWLSSFEDASYLPSWKDETGRDWFNHADGRHFFLMPEEILEDAQACARLLGFMYDEAGHQQNSNAYTLDRKRPFLYDYRGDTLEAAADHFTEAAREYAAYHGRYGFGLYTEQIIPILVHCFARAGWTPGVKTLREHWAPAYMAVAMGAALQYGREFWVSPDLWWVYADANGDKRYQVLPGHAPETYRSSMVLAYHLGADCIFSENLAHDQYGSGTGCLVLLEGDTDYRLTPHGEVARSFIKEYVPGRPRDYSIADLRPRVAIVRQPDTCWGQATSWLPDQLFGNASWQSTPVTSAWLQIWELLTRGVISKDGLSWHALGAYAGRPYQLFCPMDGVVVFDHHAGKEHLEGLDAIFLTGLGVSTETREAIEQCVGAGATCVSLPHLAPEAVTRNAPPNGVVKDGRGVWVVTKDFLSETVRDHVEHVLPEPGVIRYRFGEKTVMARPVNGDPNRLEVAYG